MDFGSESVVYFQRGCRFVPSISPDANEKEKKMIKKINEILKQK